MVIPLFLEIWLHIWFLKYHIKSYGTQFVINKHKIGVGLVYIPSKGGNEGVQSSPGIADLHPVSCAERMCCWCRCAVDAEWTVHGNCVSGGRGFTLLGSSTFPPRNPISCTIKPVSSGDAPWTSHQRQRKKDLEAQDFLLSGPSRGLERKVSGRVCAMGLHTSTKLSLQYSVLLSCPY
jgi:hypothetical protein